MKTFIKNMEWTHQTEATCLSDTQKKNISKVFSIDFEEKKNFQLPEMT